MKSPATTARTFGKKNRSCRDECESTRMEGLGKLDDTLRCRIVCSPSHGE